MKLQQPMLKELQAYLQRVSEAAPPAAERREILHSAVAPIYFAILEYGAADLLYVCTHNSRRSQFSQLWSDVAAWHVGLSNIRSHSCGTEATACNERTIAALKRCGFDVRSDGAPTNPVYEIDWGSDRPSTKLFSKAFGHAQLPAKNFIAFMTCDHADENCPHIPGAMTRVPLNYVDPKVADDTSEEALRYDERCFQIACELVYLMTRVAEKIAAR